MAMSSDRAVALHVIRPTLSLRRLKQLLGVSLRGIFSDELALLLKRHADMTLAGLPSSGGRLFLRPVRAPACDTIERLGRLFVNVDCKIETIDVHSKKRDTTGDDEIQHCPKPRLLRRLQPRA